MCQDCNERMHRHAAISNANMTWAVWPYGSQGQVVEVVHKRLFRFDAKLSGVPRVHYIYIYIYQRFGGQIPMFWPLLMLKFWMVFSPNGSMVKQTNIWTMVKTWCMVCVHPNIMGIFQMSMDWLSTFSQYDPIWIYTPISSNSCWKKHEPPIHIPWNNHCFSVKSK